MTAIRWTSACGKKHRIRLIAPHKYNRYRKNTQDGRELRRYCRRWKPLRLAA
jgi:hypothetical protein